MLAALLLIPAFFVEAGEAAPNLPGKKVIEIKKGETPISLVSFQEGGYREQSFTATKPFYAVSACVATWAADDAKVELFLYKEGMDEGAPTYDLIKRKTFENVSDGEWLMLEFDKPVPAGKNRNYSLVMKGIPGTVGWYGAEACPDIQDMPTVIIHESDLGAWYGKTEPAIPFSMRLYVEEE